MNIQGKAVVFKTEYNGKTFYETSISNKKEDGSYDNWYVSCQLPKGTDIESKTKIEVTKGFISFYRNKQGLSLPKFVIQEFTKVEEDEGTMVAEDNILPF